MEGFGLALWYLSKLALLCALPVGLWRAIKKKNRIGLILSSGILLLLLYQMFLSPFNDFGLLTRKPDPADLVADYKLDEGWGEYVAKMGYKNLNGEIKLHPDFSYEAKGIPACCVHGEDENSYPFSGGYYSFSGKWSITKSSAVYTVDLSILQISGEEVPSDVELEKYSPSRVPPSSIELHIMKGRPLSVGFSIFNGDFFEVEFARIQGGPTNTTANERL